MTSKSTSRATIAPVPVAPAYVCCNILWGFINASLGILYMPVDQASGMMREDIECSRL